MRHRKGFKLKMVRLLEQEDRATAEVARAWNRELIYFLPVHDLPAFVGVTWVSTITDGAAFGQRTLATEVGICHRLR